MTFRRNVQEMDGKRITIYDIINYIEQNNKFINKPQFEQLDMTDFHVEQKIEALGYKNCLKLDLLPQKLKAAFGNIEFNRMGVIFNVNVPSETDISFVASLLTLIIPDFVIMNEKDQIAFTEIFIRKIHKESKVNFGKFGYTTIGWTMKEFMNNVKNFKMGVDLMRYIADFLDINIFIFDIVLDGLFYIGTNHYVKYKKNLFLLRINDNKYEPLSQSDNNFMDYKSPLIQKLMDSRFLVEKVDCNYNNIQKDNEFVIGLDNLEIILNAVKPKDEENKYKNKYKKGIFTKNNQTYDSDSNGFESEHVDNALKSNDFAKHLTDRDDDVAADEVADEVDEIVEDEIIEDEIIKEVVTFAHAAHGKEAEVAEVAEVAEEVEEVEEIVKKEAPKIRNTEKKGSLLLAKHGKMKVTSSMSAQEIREIAESMAIKLTHKKNGKDTKKTKIMLIKEINEK